VALKAKRDDLSQKHEDAKQLKEGIDLRSHQVASTLKKCFTTEEFNDYEYFIKMKSKLKMEQQEIEDKINLGEEQLAALKKML
jgi:protein Shroom